MEPSPTRDRKVSGKKKIKGIRTTPSAMAKNQKILLHPRPWVRIPPINGPSVLRQRLFDNLRKKNT